MVMLAWQPKGREFNSAQPQSALLNLYFKNLSSLLFQIHISWMENLF